MLRSVSQHIKNLDWLAVTVELLIVAVGVFMGLQVQQWNQQRTDRVEEQQYLERLKADFSVIEGDLRQSSATYRDSVDEINLISNVIANPTDDDMAPITDNDSFENALVKMTAGTIPAGRSATFLEMLSTGDLSILRDAALRDLLLAYDERAQVNRETWVSIRAESSAYMQALYGHITLDVELDA